MYSFDITLKAQATKSDTWNSIILEKLLQAKETINERKYFQIT
jgi:hypothetical protein